MQEFDNTVALIVDDTRYEGWKAIQISRGMERFPSAFSLDVTEKYPNPGGIYVKPQSACRVEIGGKPVITGFVDQWTPSITPHEHTISIVGRSKCCDLVDCSADLRVTLQTIAAGSFKELVEALIKPFGLTVTAKSGDGPAIPQFNIPFGTTPWQVIDEVARYAAMVAYDDTAGNLVISRVGTERHSSGVAEGANVEAANGSYNVAGRFSTYIASIASVDLARDFRPGSALVAEVKDDTIIRNRPRFIVSEQTIESGLLAVARANWEKARRIGRSQQVTVVVDTWYDDAGNLWSPNWLIPVDLPSLRLSGVTWLVSEVAYTLDAKGTHATLTLMPPEAYTPEPSPLFAIGADEREARQQAAAAQPPATTGLSQNSRTREAPGGQ